MKEGEDMYKVRFHLAKGEHYMHWQIKDENDEVIYYDPSETNLRLTNCTLKNQMGTAEKIFRGANKSVCAWIECEDYELHNRSTSLPIKHKLSYNPKVLPFWHVRDREYHNLDNCFIKDMYTIGREVFSV